jgi:uncharacterized protein YgiM (DUF1202 family)
MKESVYGFTVVNGVVTARSGFVRMDASTSSSCVFCVSNGDIVTITGVEKLPNGEKWYKVEMGGQSGFIRSDLVFKPKTKKKKDDTVAQSTVPAVQGADNTGQSLPAVAGAVFPTAVTGTVKGSGVIMREKETTASGIIFSLNKGATVVVTGSVSGADGYIWYAVKAARNGVPFSGFIRSDLLTVNGDVTAAAGTAATLPTTLPTTLPATLPSAVPDIGGTGVTGAGAASGAASVQIGTVKGMGVNVRNNPVDGGVVAKVSTGQQVTVTGYSKANDGYVWCRISFIYNKMPSSGYIRSDFVKGIIFQ